MRSKRLYFDRKKKHYTVVKLFKTVKEMQVYYKKISPDDGNHFDTLGVCINRTLFKVKGKKWIIQPKIGEVLLNLPHCGAGIATHELMHAAFFAYKMSAKKKQYPIVLKSMEEEEDLLYSFTYIVKQFYTWYWDIKKHIK